MILVRAWRAVMALSGEGEKTASLRWLAPRADGPGAVPLGKLLKAFTTSTSLIFTRAGMGSQGIGKGSSCGCFINILA